MSRSSSRVLRELQLHQMGADAARRGIKQVTRLCNRRLRRNLVAASVMLLFPLIFEAAIFFVSMRVNPYSWPTLFTTLGILAMVAWGIAIAVWLFAAVSSVEQFLVLRRVRRSVHEFAQASNVLQPQA